MTIAMPIIRDLFWGRGALEEAVVQAALVQNRLTVELHENDSDGWFICPTFWYAKHFTVV
jgi:hypothetical protein